MALTACGASISSVIVSSSLSDGAYRSREAESGRSTGPAGQGAAVTPVLSLQAIGPPVWAPICATKPGTVAPAAPGARRHCTRTGRPARRARQLLPVARQVRNRLPVRSVASAPAGRACRDRVRAPGREVDRDVRLRGGQRDVSGPICAGRRVWSIRPRRGPRRAPDRLPGRRLKPSSVTRLPGRPWGGLPEVVLATRMPVSRSRSPTVGSLETFDGSLTLASSLPGTAR